MVKAPDSRLFEAKNGRASTTNGKKTGDGLSSIMAPTDANRLYEKFINDYQNDTRAKDDLDMEKKLAQK